MILRCPFCRITGCLWTQRDSRWLSVWQLIYAPWVAKLVLLTVGGGRQLGEWEVRFRPILHAFRGHQVHLRSPPGCLACQAGSGSAMMGGLRLDRHMPLDWTRHPGPVSQAGAHQGPLCSARKGA